MTPTLEPGALEDFSEAITLHFGHQQDVARQPDLAALLHLRMKATAHPTYADYKRALEAGPAEWEILAPLLTVPETYFFRMPAHFDALAEDVLPKLIVTNRASRTLRILSAGCASGEEAYTIRILLNERFPQLAGWHVVIEGVDLSTAAVERARLGVYTEWSLRATSGPRRIVNFSRHAKQFRLNASARAGVVFRRENLLAAPPPGEPPFDVIFCRNVLIYFTDDAIRTAIARLTERLAPGGYLFLGPAESLRGISRDYEMCHTHEAFYYRRAQTLKPPVVPTPTPPVPHSSQSRRDELEPTPQTKPSESWFDAIHDSWQRLSTLHLNPRQPRAASALKTAPAQTPHQVFLALVANERFEQALELLETISLTEDTAGLRLLRASMLTNLGRHAEAERECKLLLDADDANAGAHFLFGLNHEQTGNLSDAERHMTMATYLDPAFPMAHLHRGLIARRRADPRAARAAFEYALHAIDREDAERLALFGGGFSRASLRQVCVRELSGLNSDHSVSA